MSSKSLIFVSHIHEEKALAVNLKELIESSFLGAVEVFVSSDGQSNGSGQKWLDNITLALKSCVIEIILCSKMSVTRPWINFEAGAGWVRDIVVIPACHSGITPDSLPIPLNLLNGVDIKSVSGLKSLFLAIANSIDLNEPNINFDDFITAVKTFEENYMFWNHFNHIFSDLNKIPNLINSLKQGQIFDIDLQESAINYVSQFSSFFEGHQLLKFSRSGNTNILAGGITYSCRFVPLQNVIDKLNDPKCLIN